MKLTQYQSLAEPVRLPDADPETVTIDKWFARTSEPMRQPARLVREGLSIRPLETQLAEAPPMGWHRPQNEPVRQPQRLTREASFARPGEMSFLRSVALDWMMQPVDVIRPAKRTIDVQPSRPIEPSGFLDPPRLPLFVAMEPVRQPRELVNEGRYVSSWLNSWYVAPGDYLYWAIKQNEPVRQKPRLVTEGVSVRPLEQALALPPCTWHRPQSVPLRQRSGTVNVGLWAGVLFPALNEAPFLWAQPTQRPTRRIPQPDRNPACVFVDQPGVTLDRWAGIDRAPIRPRPANPRGGAVAPPEAPNTIFLAWQIQQPGPRRRQTPSRPDTSVYLPLVLPGDPLNIPRVDWYARAQEPVRRKAQAIHGGAYVAAPELVTVATVDKWHRQAGEPLRVRPRMTEGGAIMPPIHANTIYLGWVVPTQQPRREVRRSAPGGFAGPVVVIPGDPLNIPRVDWYSRAQEPVRRKAKALEGIALLPAPDVVTIDRWYRPADEPRRVRARMTEGGSVAPASTPNVVYLGWQIQQPGPARLPRRLTPAPLAFVAQTQPTVYLDWTQQTNQPARGRTPLAPVGRFVTVTEPSLFLPLPTPFVWYRPLCEPTRLPLRLMLGHFGFRFPRPIPATGGYAQASEVFTPHAQAGQTFTPHARASQEFTPHSEAGEVDQ